MVYKSDTLLLQGILENELNSSVMEIENISVHIKNLSKEEWSRLFALIPIIESAENFIESGGFIEDKEYPSSLMITPIIESKVVLDFESIMYELELVIPFNWSKWDKGRYIVNKGKYCNLNTITLLKILTAFIRNNRFCDGALSAKFEDRTIEKILKELKKNIERK